MRKQYEMTQEQLDRLLDACKPVPMIALHCGPIPTQQENANRAWQALGDELGFRWDTAQPAPGGSRFFSAEEK